MREEERKEENNIREKSRARARIEEIHTHTRMSTDTQIHTRPTPSTYQTVLF